MDEFWQKVTDELLKSGFTGILIVVGLYYFREASKWLGDKIIEPFWTKLTDNFLEGIKTRIFTFIDFVESKLANAESHHDKTSQSIESLILCCKKKDNKLEEIHQSVVQLLEKYNCGNPDCPVLKESIKEVNKINP